MIKRFVSVEQILAVKRLILAIFIIAVLVMPEDLIHLLAVMLHVVYESIAFALEEVLIHGVGFSKFYAQMIVFYSSLLIGVLALMVLIRRLPTMLASVKRRTTQSYIDIVNSWQLLSIGRKLALITVQFVGIVTIMAFTLV